MNDPVRPRTQNLGHRKLWLGLAALLVTAMGLMFWAFQPRPLTVDVATVTLGRFEQNLLEDGQLRLVNRYVVSAPTLAELLRPTLRVGDEVRAGDTVARLLPIAPAMIDSRTRSVLAQRVGSALAHHDAARARVAQLQTALSQAELDAEQADQLAQDRFIAAAAQTQARLRAQGARQALQVGQADLRSAEHALAEARAALARAQPGNSHANSRQPEGLWALQSPVNGQVVKLHHSSATTVQAGEPLLEIGDTQTLEAVVDVLSSDVQRIPLEAAVSMSLGGDAPPLVGTVARIEPVSFTRVSALGIEEQRVNVVVQLAPLAAATPAESTTPSVRLGDGFRVDARITLSVQDPALLLPTGALVRSGSDWQVLRLVDGQARAQNVNVRARNAEWVWIEGLDEGDSVILYPGGLIRDGQAVRARSPH
jgi:HlyD family secretion protein